jgi:hypothetical protein
MEQDPEYTEVYIPTRMYLLLAAEAKKRGTPISDYIEEVLVHEMIKEQGKGDQ